MFPGRAKASPCAPKTMVKAHLIPSQADLDLCRGGGCFQYSFFRRSQETGFGLLSGMLPSRCRMFQGVLLFFIWMILI